MCSAVFEREGGDTVLLYPYSGGRDELSFFIGYPPSGGNVWHPGCAAKRSCVPPESIGNLSRPRVQSADQFADIETGSTPGNAFVRIVAHSADSPYVPTILAGVSHWLVARLCT